MSEILIQQKYLLWTRGLVFGAVTGAVAFGLVGLLLSMVLGPFGLPVAVAICLGIALVFVLDILPRTTYRVTVYQDRLELRSKWITENVQRIEAAKIETVNVKDSLLGQQRYGYVTVVGTGGTQLVIGPIENQANLAELIRGISAGSVRASSAAQGGGAAVSDLAGQIAALDQLRQQGVLTQEQFEAAKAKVIGV